MGGPHLRLSQFLTFPLFLPQVQAVGRKCLQVLLFLQSNGSFILSVSELPRKEFPRGPIVVLFACYLYVRKMLKSEAKLPPHPGVTVHKRCHRRFFLLSDNTSRTCTVRSIAPGIPGWPSGACLPLLPKMCIRLAHKNLLLTHRTTFS